MIPPLPPGPFGAVICDPPWRYEQALGREDKGDTTRGGLPYESMSIEEIRALPVPSLMAPDSALLLWTTNSHIFEAGKVIEAWGLRYLTSLTWVKPKIGLGYWLRGQTEHALLAVKGNPRSKMTGPNGATGKAWSTALHAPLGKHSAKPPVVYVMMEDMFPGPYLELFARVRREGWSSWGNEVSDVTPVQLTFETESGKA